MVFFRTNKRTKAAGPILVQCWVLSRCLACILSVNSGSGETSSVSEVSVYMLIKSVEKYRPLSFVCPRRGQQ